MSDIQSPGIKVDRSFLICRFNHSLYRTVKLVHEGVQHSVGVSAQGGGTSQCDSHNTDVLQNIAKLNAGQYLVTVGDASYKVGGRLVPSPDTNSTELVSCVNRPDGIDITLCVRFVTLMEQSQDRG